MKYCPICRSELRARNIGGQTRLACAAAGCDFVHWNNPIPVVAGLVLLSGHYVLARNVSWPADVFSMLTGFVQSGESPEHAVLRETQEELGVRTQRASLIGHFPLPQLDQLVIAYAVEAAGEIALSDEIAEVKILSRSELASFDFGPLQLTREVVSSWLNEVPTSPRERARK